MTRLYRLAAICAAVGVALLVAIPVVFGTPQPQIHIQWRGISDSDRVSLEQTWRLSEPTRLDSTTWSYVPLDTSPGVFRGIVTHRSVGDTNGIHRREFRVADAPPLTPRRGGLVDASPWVSRAVRGVAYVLLSLAGTVGVIALASPAFRSTVRSSWRYGEAVSGRVRFRGAPAGGKAVLSWPLIAALTMGVIAFAWRYMTFAGFTNDHYIHVALAQQLLLGDVAIRDFADVGWPLMYLLSAGAWGLFGDELWVEFAICAVGFAVGTAFSVRAAHRLSGSITIALIVALAEIVASPRTYSYPKVLLYGIAAWMLCQLAAHPRGRRLGIAAILIAVSFLFRHDHGLFIGLAVAACVAIASWRDGQRVALSRVAIVTAGTAVLLIPWIVFVALNGGLASYLRQGIEYSVAEADATALRSWPMLSVVESTSTANAQAWLFWLFWLVPIVALWLALRRPDERWTGERACVISLAVLAIPVNASFLRESLLVRLPDAIVPAAVLGAWVAGRLQANRSASVAYASRALAAIAAAITVAAAALVGDFPDQFDNTDLSRGLVRAAARADEVRQQLHSSHRDNLLPASRYSIELMPFFRYVDRCADESERLVVTGEFPEMLVLAGRRFAGDVVLGSWYSSAVHQDQTVGRLRATPPLFVLHVGDYEGFRQRLPQVDEYFSGAYRVNASVPVDGAEPITILVPLDRVPSDTDTETGWPCYRGA